MVNVWFSAPHSQFAEVAILHLCKQERKRSKPVWGWLMHFLFSSDEMMSCCAGDTNGCLDLRCHAFPLDGQASTEWNRCPGSMGQRAGDSVAPSRWSSASWMPARIRRFSAGLGCKYPVTIRKASLMGESMRQVWALRHQTGTQYSAVEWTRAKVAVLNVVAPAP